VPVRRGALIGRGKFIPSENLVPKGGLSDRLRPPALRFRSCSRRAARQPDILKNDTPLGSKIEDLKSAHRKIGSVLRGKMEQLRAHERQGHDESKGKKDC
jgi:hypothetical protein